MSYLARVKLECKDKLLWVPAKTRLFVVKSFYTVMGCNGGFRFLWKSIWRTKVRLRVAFFVWSAAPRKILTIDNRWKRRVIGVDRCCMYKRNGESVYHLLYCEFAVPCGMFSSIDLGCLGLCLDE